MNDITDILDERGQVRPERVEDLLVEIATGKHLFVSARPPYDLFASRCPTNNEQERAQVVYVRATHEYRQQGMRTRSELEQFALRNEQIDPQERQRKQNLIEMAERLSKGREKTMDPTQKLEIDTQVQQIREQLWEIELNEREVFRHAAENRAEEIRTNFLVSCCTLGGEMLDTPVWANWAGFQECTDLRLIDDARRAYLRVSQGLPITIIRAVARTPEWRARWRSVRESNSVLFDSPAVSWDRNKLNIIYWSDFYDTVYQHPECPPEDVIRNDELLQDWLSQQVAKRHAPAGTKMPPPKAYAHPWRQAHGEDR
jgi:hypothetical protein